MRKRIAHIALSAAFYSKHTAVGSGAMNKFGSCCQWRHEYLKPRMLLFSVTNGAMNEKQHWELRKECLTEIENCAKTVQRVSYRHRELSYQC